MAHEPQPAYAESALTMALVADTSVWVEYLRQRGGGRRLRRALEEGEEIVVPGLVRAEILMGVPDRDADRMEWLLAAFAPGPELEYEDYLAAAALYRACRRKGRTVRGLPDCLLAQLCLRGGFTLLAHDRDFEALASVSALKLEE